MADDSKAATAEPGEQERKPSAAEQNWERITLRETLARQPERRAEFTTVSGHPIRRLYTPADLPESQHVAYVNAILQKQIETEDLARVIVNERTGVIVMGGNVRLRPGAIAQGNVTVTIAESPEVSQPGPFSAGQTRTVPRTDFRAAAPGRRVRRTDEDLHAHR